MSSPDGDAYRMSNRRLENVPAEVSHSLDVLDAILGEFEAEELNLRASSSLDGRNFDDVPQDVRKSLEVLDSILDEIERENPTPDYRLQLQNSDAQTLDRKNRHDDIRRSIEVLDSVLAEFDDCLESWDSSSHFDAESVTFGKSQLFTDFNSNAVKSCSNLHSEVQLGCRNASKDGSTSHFSSSFVPEQSRVSSPPPIPKRSPGTKLSDANLFTFPTCENSLDSLDSALSSDHVSQQRIREPLSSITNDNDSDKCCRDKCANCGRGLMRIAMEQTETSSSPFHQRKQIFEAKIAEASRSPSLNMSYGASFKQKRLQLDSSSDISGDSGFENGTELSRSHLSEKSVTVSPKVQSQTDIRNGLLNGHHGKMCTCKDKIRQLDAKFADVRRLLKLNKIKSLNSKPPDFVPPPPPLVSNGHSVHPGNNRLDSKLEGTFSRENLPRETDSSRDYIPKTSTNNSSMYSPHDDNQSVSVTGSTNSLTNSADFKLCNRCSSSLSVHTIEDLPKLLPTDALNRPHLGFSYSMEEDLPPGVKEIRQTSTPKSDVSSPRFRTKESNLSTFSHSANSLGYISSQSDLELNDLSILPDKVPISSFKSRTLPNGLDRSPFYSAEDDTFDKEYSDYNDNRLKEHHKSAILDGVPTLPPEPEKQKHKHFRVFSRKIKKDKKKNGGTP